MSLLLRISISFHFWSLVVYFDDILILTIFMPFCLQLNWNAACLRPAAPTDLATNSQLPYGPDYALPLISSLKVPHPGFVLTTVITVSGFVPTQSHDKTGEKREVQELWKHRHCLLSSHLNFNHSLSSQTRCFLNTKQSLKSQPRCFRNSKLSLNSQAQCFLGLVTAWNKKYRGGGVKVSGTKIR